MTSVFDLFKIGIGPSSSHTVGPMVAARTMLRDLRESPDPARISELRVELFGSLAWTGKGHATDVAICLGLLDEEPATVDPDAVTGLVAALAERKRIELGDHRTARFDPAVDLIFELGETLPGHSNGMRFTALDRDGGIILRRVFYSIGGGFVVTEGERPGHAGRDVVHPFGTAGELLALCRATGLSIAAVQLANEAVLRPADDVRHGLEQIRDVMFGCIERGLAQEGPLPGRLKVRRRAAGLYAALIAGRGRNDRAAAHEIMDWVSTFAIAVNEENAAGGRVVTAPTNGAAGIIPAVLRYFRDFCPEYSSARSVEFLLTAAAIGSLIKRNASISGAEVGCQGEVGSAAAMAAAGLAAGLGATPEQTENAAEIAMEHHLGMTCDPIGGLVQIPCIERNAFGAIKAIAAASLALRGDGTHHVSLDQVIETMRQTGADMQSKYKETSQGGLAVNVAEC